MIPLNNVIIEHTDENLVKVTYKTNAGSSVKYITFDDYIKSMLAARNNTGCDNAVIETPILPSFGGVSTLLYKELSSGSKILVLTREANSSDIMYFDAVFEDVGIPKLIFIVKIFSNIIQETKVFAVKDKVVTLDTVLFKYPFSNVFDSGSICFGQNQISKIDMKDLVGLHSLPNMFLAMPNNNDSYGNRNSSGLDYRPLLELLSGEAFENEWLIESGYNKPYTLKDILE